MTDLTMATIIAFLHVVMYAMIIWLGWRSYRVFRKRSWLYIGNGFLIFLGYRFYRFVSLMTVGYAPEDSGGIDTAALFVATGFLVAGFWALADENAKLIDKLKITPQVSAGDLPPEYWTRKQEESAMRAIRTTIRPEFLNPENN